MRNEELLSICGVLFDLDDTLVAFDAVTNQSWREVCLEYSTANPGVDSEGPVVQGARSD